MTSPQPTPEQTGALLITDAGAKIMQQQLGEALQKNIELRLAFDAANARCAAMAEAVEKLKAHYESSYIPRPAEAATDQGG